MDINEYVSIERNKEILTNVFVKGMNTDTSDMFLGEELYRYAENIRVVTDDQSNTSEARIIEGNSPVNVSFLGANTVIIAANSIRNIGIFIVCERVFDENAAKYIPGSWSIYKHNFDIHEDTLIFGSCDEPIIDDFDHKYLTTVLRWESDNNIKLYIADGKHELMSINVDEASEELHDFHKVFASSSMVLPELTTEIGTESGSIEGPVVQYAYRLYSLNGDATRLSSLSNPLRVYNTSNDEILGVIPNKKSTQSVKISLKNTNVAGVMDQLQVYRIAYVLIGQSPKISLVYDGGIVEEVLDRGAALQTTISDAELLSMLKLGMKPKLIESKDNHLFAANILYTQDEVDDYFKDFDARAYNVGMYTSDYSSSILNELDPTNPNAIFGNIKTKDLRNRAFESDQNHTAYVDYIDEYWEPYNGYNGYGPCIAWKYTNILYNVSNPEDRKYYRRGEVYRFGIRLFDKEGRVSSVKWIADIQFPLHNEAGTGELFNDIAFYPVNTGEDSPWNKVYAYEIVLCKRATNDKIRLFSGILGNVVQCDEISIVNSQLKTNNDIINNNFIYPTTYLSLMNITGMIGFNQGNDGAHPSLSEFRYSHPNNNIFLYIFPEYIYQPDDIKNLINSIGTNLKIDLSRNYVSNGHKYRPKENGVQDYIESIALNINNENSGEYSYLTGNVSYVFPIAINTGVIKYDNSTFLPYNILGVINNDSKYEYHINLSTCLFNYLNGNSVIHWWSDTNLIHNTTTFHTNTLELPIKVYHSNNQQYSTSFELDDEVESRYYVTSPKSDNNKKSSHTGAIITNTELYLNVSDLLPTHETRRLEANKILKNVKSFAFIKAPTDKDFATSDGNFNFNSNITSLEGKAFINWTNSYLNEFLNQTPEDTSEFLWNSTCWWSKGIYGDYDTDYTVVYRQDEPNHDSLISIQVRSADTGAGGSCMLLALNDGESIKESDLFHWNNQTAENTYKLNYMPAITVADLINSNATPYGGFDENSLRKSSYISIGAYRKKSIEGGSWNTTNDAIVASGGDTHFQRFKYCSVHQWYDNNLFNSAQPTILYDVLLETDIDLKGQYSNNLLGVTTWDYRAQEKPTSFAGGAYIQQDEAYLYNTAYGATTDLITYSLNNTSEKQGLNYDVRVHNSQKKTNGELIDNWKQFKATDFVDVDTQYGPITSLKTFRNKLIFWQEEATGVLSVNERAVVQDMNKTNIVLGVGGILDRYDYFTTIYGQKQNQHNQVSSDSTLYWWDGHNKEILGYSDGYSISQLSTVKNIKSYINKNDESDMPVLIYDNKYHEVLCNVVNNETVVYSEPVQAFTSIYTYNPSYHWDIRNKVFTANYYVPEKIYEENSTSGRSMLYGEGAFPKIEYVVNKQAQSTKTFDIQTFGGRFYGGAEDYDENNRVYRNVMRYITFSYSTPLKQHCSLNGENITTNREYDFRLNIPRNGIENNKSFDLKMKMSYGDRMRGKFMKCTIESASNNLDFSLQYITTKFRTSWGA